MGIGKIAIVGHGLGALVGFYFAAQQPGSVDRIMAVSCPLDFNSIHAQLKTSDAAELVDWLSNKSPESLNALSDASKADPARRDGFHGELSVRWPLQPVSTLERALPAGLWAE